MATTSLNTLLPLGSPSANVINNLKMNVNKLNKTVNQAFNTATGTTGGNWKIALGIFVVFVIIFIFVLTYYQAQIKDGYIYLMNSVRSMLGYEEAPQQIAPPPPIIMKEPGGEDVLKPMRPPQNETIPEKEATKPFVEKILPSVSFPEVFNVSKNTFTYYDAEPLCRALGAELATYDQVKESWEKGADWCNYGWVKGQAAVYPTQKGSWERLQAGPVEQRAACGVPGVNGGFFDNPELRFGVNCYGTKPSQSKHDEEDMNKGVPLSPAALAVQKKVDEFKREASTIGILPFSSDKWSS